LTGRKFSREAYKKIGNVMSQKKLSNFQKPFKTTQLIGNQRSTNYDKNELPLHV
jgi:hypothetical protein